MAWKNRRNLIERQQSIQEALPIKRQCAQECYIPVKFNSEAWVWGRLCNPFLTLLTAALRSDRHQSYQAKRHP